MHHYNKKTCKTEGVTRQHWHHKAASVVTICHVVVENSRVQSSASVMTSE